MTNLERKSIATKLELKVHNIIMNENFPVGKRFIRIAEALIRRQARRQERIRLGKTTANDIANGFTRSNFSYIY